MFYVYLHINFLYRQQAYSVLLFLLILLSFSMSPEAAGLYTESRRLPPQDLQEDLHPHWKKATKLTED